MRVLMACAPDAHWCVRELCQALREQGVTVDLGLSRFWLRRDEYDIVHLQWPEALFEWRTIMWSEVRSLFREVLPEWRNSARIVLTRHNDAPHFSSNSHWQYLYDHIYEHVDGVVHLGECGLPEFKARHGETVQRHRIIPLQTYGAYGPPVDSIRARRMLGISRRSKVVLAFGQIRHEPERRLIQDAFFQISIPGKVLVAPQYGQCLRPSRRDLLKWGLWELTHREVLWPRRLHLGHAFVPDDRVSAYFGAADVVLIPRLDTLNSGVIPLAFQYGKTVVGPDAGNMGLILRSAGNPTFDPSSVKSCASAIEMAFESAEKGLGVRNLAYAHEHWAIEKVARMHSEFYETVLKSS